MVCATHLISEKREQLMTSGKAAACMQELIMCSELVFIMYAYFPCTVKYTEELVFKDHLSIETTVGWSKDHLSIETTVGWSKDHLSTETTVGWSKDHLSTETASTWSLIGCYRQLVSTYIYICVCKYASTIGIGVETMGVSLARIATP